MKTFVEAPFQIGASKSVIHVAFIQPRVGSESIVDDLYETYFGCPSSLIPDSFLSMAYYLEWDSKSKAHRACFGIIYKYDDLLRKSALFKRGGIRKDFNDFGQSEFGQSWKTLDENLFSYFVESNLDLMLANIANLPVGANSWSYLKDLV